MSEPLRGFRIGVPDASAFMNRFCLELRIGATPRGALRNAQLWMLEGKGDPAWRERFAQPYHWAPFVCIGSW